MRSWRWTAAFLLSAAVVALVHAGAAAASETDEAALRRRVQRFYVLSYLNRHGEMWEMFTSELQRRMGDDKREYIASARKAGFELYSSRIEAVTLRTDGAAIVDVALQVQLPGTVDATWRRHRMAWRSGADGWRYAGSLDVTSDDSTQAPEGADWLPTQQATAPEGSDDLLPPRRVAPPPPPVPAAKVATADKPAPATAPVVRPDGSLEGDRWDLVALPPEGTTRPATVPDTTPVTTPAPEAPSPAPSASTRPAPPRPKAPRPRTGPKPQWLPPDRAAVAAMPTPPAPADPSPVNAPGAPEEGSRRSPQADAASRAAVVAAAADAGEDSIENLVRRVMDGSGMRRLRALEKIRTSTHPRLASLAAQAIPHAPPGSQVVLVERLGALGTRADVPMILGLLESTVPDVRAAAAGALGELGATSDASALVAMLRAETAPVARVAGFRALGRLGGGGSEGAEILARALGDGKLDDPERAAAARAVADAQVVEAEPAVLRVLGQQRPYETFLATVAAAGRLATPATIRALESLAAEGGVVKTIQAEQPVRLLALRGLAAAGVEGAGLRLAREMLVLGGEATALDVEGVAASGETAGLAELLLHPSVMVRIRAADLLGRSVEDAQAAARAMPFIERALAEDHDPRVLVALQLAKQRLSEK